MAKKDEEALTASGDEAYVVAEEEPAPEPLTYEEEAAQAPESNEPHILPVIRDGTWVLLGHTDNVPAEMQGHEAVVISAPIKVQRDPDEFSVHPYEYQDGDEVFTVRTRDQYSAEFTATRDDFDEISYKGRVGLPSAG